jgi:hypothetical protein
MAAMSPGGKDLVSAGDDDNTYLRSTSNSAMAREQFGRMVGLMALRTSGRFWVTTAILSSVSR